VGRRLPAGVYGLMSMNAVPRGSGNACTARTRPPLKPTGADSTVVTPGPADRGVHVIPPSSCRVDPRAARGVEPAGVGSPSPSCCCGVTREQVLHNLTAPTVARRRSPERRLSRSPAANTFPARRTSNVGPTKSTNPIRAAMSDDRPRESTFSERREPLRGLSLTRCERRVRDHGAPGWASSKKPVPDRSLDDSITPAYTVLASTNRYHLGDSCGMPRATRADRRSARRLAGRDPGFRFDPQPGFARDSSRYEGFSAPPAVSLHTVAATQSRFLRGDRPFTLLPTDSRDGANRATAHHPAHACSPHPGAPLPLYWCGPWSGPPPPCLSAWPGTSTWSHPLPHKNNPTPRSLNGAAARQPRKNRYPQWQQPCRPVGQRVRLLTARPVLRTHPMPLLVIAHEDDGVAPAQPAHPRAATAPRGRSRACRWPLAASRRGGTDRRKYYCSPFLDREPKT